jgi:hypothetical protein
LFVVCLIVASVRAHSGNSTLPLGVGQKKTLGLDAPKGLRKFCEKFLDPRMGLVSAERDDIARGLSASGKATADNEL